MEATYLFYETNQLENESVRAPLPGCDKPLFMRLVKNGKKA
jgi:hypothetical protein